MIFKELTYDNITEIIDIFISAFNTAPWNDTWTKETAEKRIRQTIKFPDSYGLIAYDEGKPAGFILGHIEYYCNKTQFVINEFCVDKNIKGKGIGTQIITELEKRIKSKEISEINLITLNSPDTKLFYEKRGYNISADSIVMNKNI